MLLDVTKEGFLTVCMFTLAPKSIICFNTHMKKTIITIAGKVGSGKSSTAKKLAERLSYDHYSSGDFARAVAKKHDMTITQWNTHAEQYPELDHEVDNENKKMADKEHVVIDSRLAFHFIPESFKVFLDIDPSIAAERIYGDLDAAHRTEEHRAKSIEDMAHDLRVRSQSETKRYQELYNINHQDHEHFDLVIDTGLAENNLDAVVEQIYEAYHTHSAS